jgi:hypothetical protein
LDARSEDCDHQNTEGSGDGYSSSVKQFSERRDTLHERRFLFLP